MDPGVIMGYWKSVLLIEITLKKATCVTVENIVFCYFCSIFVDIGG